MNDAPGHALRGLVLRFTVWAAVLAGLLVAWGAQVERAVLPWLGTVLRTIDPDAMSPREALEALYRLKSLLGARA